MVVPKAKSRASSLLSLKKSEDAVFRKKVQKYRQEYKTGKQPRDRHGVICLSNIPHGFCENEMRRYFSQYGDVLKTKLVRSERTGESCGYGFVKFEHWEVASIVAKTINGYLTFGKIMKCRLMDNNLIPEDLFRMRHFRQNNCPKMLIRKNAINKLNKVRSKKEDSIRIKRLKTAYRRKLGMLKGLGISLNLELPQVQIQGKVNEDTKCKEESLNAETNDSETMDTNEEQKGEVAEVKENQAVEKAEIAEVEENQAVEKAEVAEVRETQAIKVKGSVSSKPKKLKKIKRTDKKASGEDIAQDGHHSGKMVIEVDQSDVEVQFKTPPNAVKKFVQMAPFKVTENTVVVKPISTVPKMNPKKEGATASLTENTLLDEEKNAAAGLANQDGNGALESIMPSNPLVTRNEKMAIKKKKKTVKSISKCKENTPLSTASDISLPKTTPMKRKQANNQTPAKKLLKKMKAIPSPASLDAQVVSVGKDSSIVRTPISSKSISNGIDMSNFAQVTEDISQLSHVQTSEEPQFSIASKKDISTKRSKVTKKSVSPLTAVTKTPKKMQKLKKGLTPKTLQSNSLTPKLADLENATVFPEKEITSPGTNTVEDKEVMENTEEMSHGVGNPTQTLEEVQIPPVSEKMGNADCTQTPPKAAKVKKVVTPKSIDSKSMPFKREEVKNFTIFQKSEINTSPGTNTAIGQVMTNISQLPLAEENSKQNSDQGQLSANFKKIKTPKRRGNPDHTETPKEVKQIKNVLTPKTPDCNSLLPNKAGVENVVLSKIETDSSQGTDTAKRVEVVTNTSHLSPTVEDNVNTSEEKQLALSAKKTKTPGNKTKKTPKRERDSSNYTETPKKVKHGKKLVTPKKAELESVLVFSESEIETSKGANTPKSVETVPEISHSTPAVETSQQVPQSSKKNKTPKKRESSNYIETPVKVKKVEKVVAPKTPDCNGLPPKKADSENVIVLSGSEIETSCKTDTSRSGEMVTNAPQLPLTVETPIKASEEMKLPLSTKKNKTPKTKTPKKTPKRQDSLEDTEIPKKVKKVQTPKTPACKSLPPKRAKSNILVFSESEMTPLGANNTPRIVEAVTNSSQLSPPVETPIKTSEQVQLSQSSKKNKTPKRIKNMGFTETPKMV